MDVSEAYSRSTGMGVPFLLLFLLLVILPVRPAMGQGGTRAGNRSGSVQAYSVATLAPPGVVVPPIVLSNSDLHALLVELGGGASLNRIRERIGLSTSDFESLLRLVEVEGLGRQLGGDRWRPLALALDSAGVGRLQATVAPLAADIADTLTAHWARLDSSCAALPVTGCLPLEQTGWVVLGSYLLGLFQHEALWEAGLGPRSREYAFRVYRMNPDEAPPGAHTSPIELPGFSLIRCAPTAAPFGFDALLDPNADLHASLFTVPGSDTLMIDSAGEGRAVAEELIRAYRRWYLTGEAPDRPTRILLRLCEAIDEQERLRIPIIAAGELGALRLIALDTGARLWPRLMEILPAVSETAAGLGYGEEALLGEVTLAAWELAVHRALDLLVERGLIAAPIAGRGQLLLTVANH